MRVRDWMTPDPVVAKPATTIPEAQRRLRNHRIRHLPIVEYGRVVGIVSDRDVSIAPAALRQVTERLAADSRAGVERDAGVGLMVVAVMSAPVCTVDADEDVLNAARLMLDRRIGALPVLDDGTLVGMFCRTDCIRAALSLTDQPDHRSSSEPAPV